MPLPDLKGTLLPSRYLKFAFSNLPLQLKVSDPYPSEGKHFLISPIRITV